MKRLAVLTVLAASLTAAPALADLKPGTKAPAFSAPAYLAGKPFTFELSKALKQGPVVLYFFPSAFTKGCSIEARLFSTSIDKFKAQKATVIGVTAGKVDELARFSADTETCGGKFPVAADPGAKIAMTYDAPLLRDGKPTNLSSRTSYVIAPDGRIVEAYTNGDPNGHVDAALAALKTLKTKR